MKPWPVCCSLLYSATFGSLETFYSFFVSFLNSAWKRPLSRSNRIHATLLLSQRYLEATEPHPTAGIRVPSLGSTRHQRVLKRLHAALVGSLMTARILPTPRR